MKLAAIAKPLLFYSFTPLSSGVSEYLKNQTIGSSSMKYLLLTIVLSIFSVTVSAKCADGYLCKDFLGNTYYNQNGMKHLTERNQKTINLLSTIAKPPQTNIFATLQQLQTVQLQAAQIKAAKTPKPKRALTLEDRKNDC